MSDNRTAADLRRRDFLAAAGVGAVAVATLPRMAKAEPKDADALVAKLIGGAQPKEGKVKIQMKDMAESGAAEPIAVTVDSPMTAADHVKALHIVSEGNPNPGVSSWHFTPRSGKAEVSFRMRLGKTQVVRAYAVMSDGSVYMDKHEIKVTISGC